MYCQSRRSDYSIQGNMSIQSTVGVYDHISKAEKAIQGLEQGGFPIEQVSIVFQSLSEKEEVHGYIIVGDGAKSGTDLRVWRGGLFGLLPGAAFVWVPGLGQLVVVGPLATALLEGIEKAEAGSTGRGLLNVLIGWGVPRKYITGYKQDLKAGRYLVVAHGSIEEGAKARDILQGTGASELHVHDREIGLARFVALDPDAPAATESELEYYIPKIRGVIDWAIHPNGDVTLEYDSRLVARDEMLIEEALTALGFKVKHIYDHPVTDEAEVEEALDHETL